MSAGFVFMVLVKLSASRVGKRWKLKKFGPIYERSFVYGFSSSLSYSKKFNISTKFGNYGNDLYAIFVFVQYFGKLFIVRK